MSNLHFFLLCLAVFIGVFVIVVVAQNIYYKRKLKQYNKQVETQKEKIESYRAMMKEQQRVIYRPKN